MFIGQDLLHLLLLSAVLVLWARAARPMTALGRAGPAPSCAVPIERTGRGVECVSADDALRNGLRAGQGMAPDRLAAWDVALDANHASVAELASLPGVGPALAKRIVEARPFATVEDVARVRGIGRRRLARLRARLFLDE
jgi:competence ComEA-like helix-hairpin-helix protein